MLSHQSPESGRDELCSAACLRPVEAFAGFPEQHLTSSFSYPFLSTVNAPDTKEKADAAVESLIPGLEPPVAQRLPSQTESVTSNHTGQSGFMSLQSWSVQ